MTDRSGAASKPKSLADILEEELDGELGQRETQADSLADKQQRLRDVYNRIAAEQPARSALCLSGGGIRSAMFGLGILQGLARRHLLDHFDYLSTVSGGGYVGGWLSAWIKNHERGAEGVAEELHRQSDLTLKPEPEPIRHLRKFSNYLTPKTGLTSVDSWTLIATYLRNLFLNWLVLISWLAAAMMVPRIHLVAILLPPAGWEAAPDYLSIVAAYDIVRFALLAAGFALVAVAMAYAIIDVPATGNAGLPQSRFLLWRQLPIVLASILLAEWWALTCNIHGNTGYRSTSGMVAFVVFAVGTYLAGGCLGVLYRWLRRKAWFGGQEVGLPRKKLGRYTIIASVRRGVAIIVTTAIGGFCLWAGAMYLFPNPAGNAINYVCFAPALVMAVLLLVNFLFTGLASWVSDDPDREWWARSAAWLLISICAWILVNVIVLWGAQAVAASGDNRLAVFLGDVQANPIAKALLGAFGGTAGLVAVLLALRSKLTKLFGSRWILAIVAAAFFVLLSLVLSWLLLFLGAQPWAAQLGQRLLGRQETYQVQLVLVFVLTAATLLLGIVMGFFINVNKFSLHAMYRSRLIRAFLAASRPEAPEDPTLPERFDGTKKFRTPHQFTGFDPEDNIDLHTLRPGKPFHVVNAALNLVKGQQLAWQERKAQSFTMSRLHCGSWHLGYRPSEQFGGKISLGTALTISGAAASPNMGYHSSPIVGFLMTLFNVRLGWWLGNPGQPGAHTWKRRGPTYAVGPLFAEALGNTTDCYKYINLSDGGHFENLGLYEMVLRRCRYILVVDAGQDFDYVFEDLGNAIRKIRIDLGIPINITVGPPKRDPKGTVNRCLYGTIEYSVVDKSKLDGALLYIKPVIGGDEPPDVFNYAAAHPEFPHEPTTDQWFSESQLESYRRLGLHAVDVICGQGWKQKSLPDFFAQVKSSLAAGSGGAG